MLFPKTKKRNFDKDEELGRRALVLEVVLSKVFDEEGLLLDTHQRSFHSSSLLPHTPPLIFIIDSQYHYDHDLHEWKTVGKNLQQLQFTSKELQVIYVGNRSKSIQSELPIRILAYTPDNSSFCRKLYSIIHPTTTVVFRSSDELEEKGLKCLSAWEDISSYISLDPVNFLINTTPRENNIELPRELLVTEETDYLLLNENLKVKIADEQGKIILLLVTFVDDENHVSAWAVKEIYLKMQQESYYNHPFQVVWVPVPWDERSWEDFERAAGNASWPRVPNPWLLKKRIVSFVRGNRSGIPCVCVVDEKGRISNRDALATIDRWGEEAFPFSQGREEELWKAEREAFEFNSLSTLQFLVQNLDFLPNRAKERRLICVGPPEKMKELVTDLDRALTMLEIDFHVVYVAHSSSYYDEKAWQKSVKELKESEVCSIATLPLCDVYKFWRRVKHLQKDLGIGSSRCRLNARRMVWPLGAANRGYMGSIKIFVVDGNGEMVSRRGMKMVELLCHGEEDSKVKFLEEIKKEGIEKSMQSRWSDGIIHPKHYPQHPLLKPRNRNEDISCSLCGQKDYKIYLCIVCEKYVICRSCCESGV